MVHGVIDIEQGHVDTEEGQYGIYLASCSHALIVIRGTKPSTVNSFDTCLDGGFNPSENISQLGRCRC